MGTLRVDLLRPSSRTIESMVHLYGNRIYQLAWHITGSEADAEDVAQEVFLKLFRGWGRIAAARNVDAWITRMTANASIDLLRSRTARARRERPMEGTPEPSEERSPGARLDRRELNERLREAVRELPAQQAAAIILFDHEGLPGREVAGILGVAEATVRGYVADARRRVRERLRPYLAGGAP